MTDARQKALEEAIEALDKVDNLMFANLGNEQLTVEEHVKLIETIRKALQPQTVDVEGLNEEFVEWVIREHNFNNPNSDAQKLTVMVCSLWNEYLASQGYLNAGWQPIETAPKDGTIIFVASDDLSLLRRVVWSLDAWVVVDTKKNNHKPL